MERGLYIAASGMLSELTRQNQLANDLANVSTAGYKADRVSQRSFGELLLSNTKTGETIGRLGLGSEITKFTTDLSAKPLKQTDEPLDLAVAGEGFFAVQTEAGVRFTRNGAFASGANGTLVDQLGNAVLGPDRRPVTLAADGTVASTAVGVFAVANATKAGDALFTGTAGGPATGSVKAGHLEGSGVDSAHTMIEMLGSLRAFEASQRAITTIDQTLQKASNQVGSMTG
ncbi:Flagellar basal-body rod protein FlgG [Paraconexibacter sp. AEG42_29]|uniref:Flagellar basal-body rod protein FlgG n=1 Tax=Paraconexibacter sp. AEG42_29 TaxID=2997339 RepID=A0AAU7ANQ1_9ACTN